MLKPPVTQKDNVAGLPGAAITLVEYGDYECPHCGHAYGIIKNIQAKLKDRLQFVFRNFPIQNTHPHAYMAAVATEAAARQNAFWAMHDILFENQDKLSLDELQKYARNMQLNLKEFDLDIRNQTLRDKVDNDIESGLRSGVNATPTFFINGNRYNGIWEEYDLLNALQATTQKYNHVV